MSKYAISVIHPRVTPIPGEALRYYVSSGSRKSVQHVVDLSGYYGNGQCSCEAFCFKAAPRWASGEVPSEQTECRHIREAKRHLALTVIRRAIAKAGNRDNVGA